MPRDPMPPSARTLATATTDAVEAAQRQDVDDFATATERLAASDPAHVRLVLGAVVRSLLEETHEQGLTGDDAQQVLREAATAASWCPDVDPEVLVVLLAGALGITPDEDDAPPAPAPVAVARHAALLVASPSRRSAAPLPAHLSAALTDIERSETFDD